MAVPDHRLRVLQHLLLDLIKLLDPETCGATSLRANDASYLKKTCVYAWNVLT